MKVLPFVCGVLIVVTGGQLARGQAALERLEKRLQKPGNPAVRPGAAAPARPAPVPEVDDRPAPREVEFQPGYLGAITDDRFDPDRGVRIVEAVADGPAAAAGLEEDDLLVGVNGRPVKKNADLARVLERSPPGAELTFDIERNGEKLRVEVTLAERPAPGNRRAAEFGPIPDDDDPLGPAANGPALPNPRAPAANPDDRVRRLEQRIEQLEQRLERIEKLLNQT